MSSWYHCDIQTGAIRAAGFSPNETEARLNTAPDGCVLFMVADGLIYDPFSNPDFSRLKDWLRGNVDREAGDLRAQYVTDVPGQAQTYEKKEAEARLWTDGDETAHPERYPFMLTEAQVRAVPISQVRAEIMAQVNLLTPVAALIEAHRVAAKMAVSAATTIPEIMTAGTVDWQSLVPTN